MRKWSIALVVVAAAMGSVVSFSLREPSQRPQYVALTVPQQNLLMYDEFWTAVDANYFEPKLLATPRMRELRRTWRSKAEAANSIEIYWGVLDQLALQFPHSHIEVKPRFKSEDLLAAMATPDTAEHYSRMSKLLVAGPGFESPRIRRTGGRQWIVGDVITGSSAEKAGITPGWRILSANSSFTVKENKVRFTGEFAHDGAAVETIKIMIDVEPRPEPQHFQVRRLADEATYVRFDLFGEVGEPDKVLAAIDAAGPRGLVLDLRGNVGGFNADLERIAGRLLGGDVAIGTMIGRDGSKDQRTRRGPRYSGPLLILIGPVSSSAAEILAAAVQDHARGKLIGRATNGSVLSAKFFPLPDGGAVMVPTHDFRRIDGRRIEGVGVEPDIEILPALEDVRAGRDPVLARAIVELRGGE